MKTTKLDFIVACCHVFNCSPAVVLSALSKPVKDYDTHSMIKRAIRRIAHDVTKHSLAQWKTIVPKIERRSDVLYRLAYSAEVRKFPLP